MVFNTTFNNTSVISWWQCLNGGENIGTRRKMLLTNLKPYEYIKYSLRIRNQTYKFNGNMYCLCRWREILLSFACSEIFKLYKIGSQFRLM